jgi:hypothetical protein
MDNGYGNSAGSIGLRGSLQGDYRMKIISKIIITLACIFTLHPLTADNSFSMELVFKDPQYSFQTLRALGYAVSGGADFLLFTREE